VFLVKLRPGGEVVLQAALVGKLYSVSAASNTLVTGFVPDAPSRRTGQGATAWSGDLVVCGENEKRRAEDGPLGGGNVIRDNASRLLGCQVLFPPSGQIGVMCA
jgi:hypothetical protein